MRQIERAVAIYLRLVSTLVSDDTVGLGVSDSDQLTLLVRSLPETAKQYVLHHSTGESTLRIVRPPFDGNTSKDFLLNFKDLRNFSALGSLGMIRLRNPKMGMCLVKHRKDKCLVSKVVQKDQEVVWESRHQSGKLAARKAT